MTITDTDQRTLVFSCLRATKFADSHERVLRQSLERSFAHAGLTPSCQVVLDYNGGIIDFLFRDGLAIVVRSLGTYGDAFLSLRTIAADDRVTSMLLVTTRAVHRTLPGGIGQKPLEVFWVEGLS